jgi:pimeloyl-ACP methyl ester carboxylesterase
VTLTSFSHDGLDFDVTDSGEPGGRCVILLHGFPADRQSWDAITPRLNDAGYRTLAPDQRGYSPRARPPDRRSYRMVALAGDVLALADAAGAERVDVIGHDWGASVAWNLAARHPGRVRSLAAVSVPHPAAFAAALRRPDQLRKSWYMGAFQLALLPERLLGRGRGEVFRRQLERSGLDPASAARYASRAAAGAMTGPLNWYRALPFDLPGKVPPVEVPSLFVWGDQDAFLTPRAAEGASAWMRGPRRVQRLSGASHWIPETAAGQLADLLLEHLGSVPA